MMRKSLAQLIVYFGLLMAAMLLTTAPLQAEDFRPIYTARRVYLGEFRGHREETVVLQNMLTNALLKEGFAVVNEPGEAEFLVEGEMGFKDVWGEYTESRNYRVYATIHIRNPHGKELWTQSFIKKPRCSRQCFRKIAQSEAVEFRKKAGITTLQNPLPEKSPEKM